MPERTIRVITKAPGLPPTIELVPATLEAYQGLVGGLIEQIRLIVDDSGSLCLIVNEEGRLLNLDPNFTLGMAGGVIVGPVFFVRGDDRTGEFVSLTEADVRLVYRLFDLPEPLHIPNGDAA